METAFEFSISLLSYYFWGLNRFSSGDLMFRDFSSELQTSSSYGLSYDFVFSHKMTEILCHCKKYKITIPPKIHKYWRTSSLLSSFKFSFFTSFFYMIKQTYCQLWGNVWTLCYFFIAAGFDMLYFRRLIAENPIIFNDRFYCITLGSALWPRQEYSRSSF